MWRKECSANVLKNTVKGGMNKARKYKQTSPVDDTLSAIVKRRRKGEKDREIIYIMTFQLPSSHP